MGFLGDPRFPEQALKETSRGQKILCFQKLFSEYSALGFTNHSDRAVAIAGLEARLREGFRTNGRHGIFGDGPDGGFLHRSLLWKRKSDTECLLPIKFNPERSVRVPTWSWMAYEGAIDYHRPPHGMVNWSIDVVPVWGKESAQQRAPQDGTRDYLHPGRMATMEVIVCPFDNATRLKKGQEFHLDDDRTQTSSLGILFCVVIGTKISNGHTENKEHYVLLVRAKPGLDGTNIYERVGVGSMLGRHIDHKLGISGTIH